jgi:hypothetical protein
LEFDHRPEDLWCKGLAGMMKARSDTAAIRVPVQPVRAGLPVEEEAVALKRCDYPADGEALSAP